jgi:membrane protease YdiL (CAAX protease family)
MGSTPISTTFFLTSLAMVAILEVVGGALGEWIHLPRLWSIAGTRTFQAMAVLLLAGVLSDGPLSLGLDKKKMLSGLKKGLIWSAVFAGVAGLTILILISAGQDPLRLIRSPLPVSSSQQMLFFFVGGVLAPITEEMVFRGLIFGYLRRWGLPAAVLISTTLFAAFHLPGIPAIQIVGGVVFSIAYHVGKSLMTPIVIHMLGNLAIFTLSLPVFH